ncbi:MAG: zeta toxin family protein [Muribaculaceae bacterium]|nr:zeta toxin family protein [Muribaculaceae bacterium]
MTPKLYIIAGCNGAGKTTASFTVLPEALNCREFVNADEIAKGLSPFCPEEMAIVAGRLMLQRIQQLMAQRQTFAIETTLATRSYRNTIRRAHAAGYEVVLLYFWLPSPELAISRVAQRVRNGGHNIPDDVVRQRYYHGLHNFFEIFMPIVDYWAIYDNSRYPIEIANSDKVSQPKIFRHIANHVTQG